MANLWSIHAMPSTAPIKAYSALGHTSQSNTLAHTADTTKGIDPPLQRYSSPSFMVTAYYEPPSSQWVLTLLLTMVLLPHPRVLPHDNFTHAHQHKESYITPPPVVLLLWKKIFCSFFISQMLLFSWAVCKASLSHLTLYHYGIIHAKPHRTPTHLIRTATL